MTYFGGFSRQNPAKSAGFGPIFGPPGPKIQTYPRFALKSVGFQAPENPLGFSG